MSAFKSAKRDFANESLDSDTVTFNITPFRSKCTKQESSTRSEYYGHVSVKEMNKSAPSSSSRHSRPESSQVKLSHSPDKRSTIEAIAVEGTATSEHDIYEAFMNSTSEKHSDHINPSGTARCHSDTRTVSLIRQRLRKEAIKAFALVGGPNCSSITLEQFHKCMVLVGIVNEHSRNDDSKFMRSLLEQLFELSLRRTARESSEPGNMEARRLLDMEGFIRLAETVFNIAASGASLTDYHAHAEDKKYTELCTDLYFRKHMSRRATLAVRESTPLKQSRPAGSQELSRQPSYYRQRYEEMKASLESETKYELTFKPVTNVVHKASATDAMRGGAQSDASPPPPPPPPPRRPNDRRSSIQREMDMNCTFQPANIKENPFASERAGQSMIDRTLIRPRKQAAHNLSSSSSHALASSSSNRIPFDSSLYLVGAPTGWGMFASRTGLVPGTVPDDDSEDIDVYCFDPTAPPNFSAGTYLSLEMVDETQDVKLHEASAVRAVASPLPLMGRPPTPPPLPPHSFTSTHKTPPPTTPKHPQTHCDSDVFKTARKSPRATPKATRGLAHSHSSPHEEGDDYEEGYFHTPKAAGWEAILQEMALKRGGMGLTSALKTPVQSKKKSGRRTGNGQSKKTPRTPWGSQSDPEFVDVIDELKYRLERMKKGSDSSSGGRDISSGEFASPRGSGSWSPSGGSLKGLLPTDEAAHEGEAREDSTANGYQLSSPRVKIVLFAPAPAVGDFIDESVQRVENPPRCTPSQSATKDLRPAVVTRSTPPPPPPLPSTWPPSPAVVAAGVYLSSSPADTRIPQMPLRSPTRVLRLVTHQLPAGLYLPYTAIPGAETVPPGHVRSIGPLSEGLRQALGNLSRGDGDEDWNHGDESNVHTNSSSSHDHDYTGSQGLGADFRALRRPKLTAEALPVPSNYWGAIRQLRRATEDRDRIKERDKQREMRYYDSLPPDGIPKPLQITVPQEFSFAQRDRAAARHCSTHRAPKVSNPSLLPHSYYMPSKVLINPANQHLSNAFFMSTLREPMEPLAHIVASIPPLATAPSTSTGNISCFTQLNDQDIGSNTDAEFRGVEESAVRSKGKGKSKSSLHEPIGMKVASAIREAREKKEAEKKRLEEEARKKKYQELRRRAIVTAQRNGVYAPPAAPSGNQTTTRAVHAKLLNKYCEAKPQPPPSRSAQAGDKPRPASEELHVDGVNEHKAQADSDSGSRVNDEPRSNSHYYYYPPPPRSPPTRSMHPEPPVGTYYNLYLDKVPVRVEDYF